MTKLYGSSLALQIVAALVALAVARGRKEHRPVAWFLAGTTLANLARLFLQTFALGPARAMMRAAGADPTVTPLAGLARLAGHAESALFLTWPFGLAALAVAVFAKRRPWALVVAWALTVVVLVLELPRDPPGRASPRLPRL